MNIDYSAEALEYGRQVQLALEAAGGEVLTQQAERDTDGRAHMVATVERVLGELGAWDLSPRTDADELEAAATLCRAVGNQLVAYPVAERLARPIDLAVDGLIVVDPSAPQGVVAGVEVRWATVTLDGRRSLAATRPLVGSARATAFVTDLDLQSVDGDGADDIALALTLGSCTLLGMLDRAIDLTRLHVREREQFGQPLASFQNVQFRLTDAEVERSGVDMLAKYTLASIQHRAPDALLDALALRMAAIEAAEIVMRVCHQLHGATGFCDETTLSWASRYSQPLRRLPFGVSATREHLTMRLGRRALSGLFS